MTLLAKKRISYLRQVSQLVVITLSFLVGVSAVAQPRFFISGEGAFLEQMHDGTAYTVIDSQEGDFTDHPIGPILYVKPGHKLSGGGEIGAFLSNGFDIRFGFFIHQHSAFDSEEAPEDAVLSALLLPATFGPGDTLFASSSFSFGIHMFSLTLGHLVRFNRLFSIHPYLGGDVSDIEMKQNTMYNVTLPLDGASVGYVQESSSITGIGPMVGTTLDYKLFRSLSLVGDINVAMLMGKSKYSLSADREGSSLGGPTATSNRVSLNFERLNFKVGLRYQRALARLSQMGIMLGYRITKYIGSSPVYTFVDDLQSALLVGKIESAGFEGPFFSITLMS